MKPKGHTLCSDHQQYDHSTGINDVLCGGHLDALHQLPNNLRQLLEDSNMHVELVDFGGRNVIGKIVKRRESEFLTGQTKYFVYDNEGHRIPIEEEEFDKQLGLQHNPDDVFNSPDITLESIESEVLAPMDVYDVVYDCTEYLRNAERLLENEEWQVKSVQEKQADLAKLANELIYSANWFQYSADKRIHGYRAKQIAAAIKKGLTRAQLGALIGPRSPEKRIKIAQQLRKQALSMPLGPQRVQVFTKAQKLVDEVVNGRRKARSGKIYDPISDTDRATLWAQWREREINVNGSVQLMSWQFQKMYYAKLDKQVKAGTLTALERDQRVREAMRKLYGTNKVVQRVQEDKTPTMPSWLLEAVPPAEVIREYDEWIPPSNSGITNIEDEEEWLENVLLETSCD